MASRLSSLLVRDGLVGVKRMEKAFQRQVIYGGSLDTTLLEMGMLAEERVTQYLALASGLPPATRQECNVFDATAVRLCSPELAARYRAVPLCFDDGTLRVVVHDPVEIGLLESLADHLNVPVLPLIVPEYRWHLVFSRNYGGQPPARFSTLARTVDGAPLPASGLTREPLAESDEHQVVDVQLDTIRPARGDHALPSVVHAEASEPVATVPSPLPQAVPSVVPRTVTVHVAIPPMPRPVVRGAAPDPGADEVSNFDRVSSLDRVAVPDGGANASDVTAHDPNSSHHSAQSQDDAATGVPPTLPIGRPASSPVPVPSDSPTPSSDRGFRDSGPTSDGVPRRPLIGNTPPSAGSQASPVDASQARRLILGSDHREEIFSALLGGLRSRARWAGLLMVQHRVAIGRMAVAEPELDTSLITSVVIPLTIPSRFQAVIDSRHPYVGAIATDTPEIDVMITRMGGMVPPSALLLPVVLRDRCVALAVAHRGDQPIHLAEVSPLLPLAAATADSLSRLIVRQKSANYPVANPDSAAVSGEIDRAEDSGSSPPGPDRSVPAGARSPGDERAIAEILDEIERDDIIAHETALGEALRRPAEVLPELRVRFPGRLRLDRYHAGARALRPGQYGGLLELAVRLGGATSELLLEKLADPNRDIRFYAAACVAVLRPRNAVHALVERLFDADHGVRTTAIDALAGYPLRDLDLALTRVRHALHSEDLDRVRAATSAIAALADIHAIADLIEILGHGTPRATLARRALAAITGQNYGHSQRRWRRWWEDNRFRHRVEWLVEALAHNDPAARAAAIDDLSRLTGERFGFVAEAPRRDRQRARARWVQWWIDDGRRRYVGADDERSRTTAIVPTRRHP